MSILPDPPAPDDHRRADSPEPTGSPLRNVRVYPMPVAGDDPRFTFGLTMDVADALARHGYPVSAGGDFVALQQALFVFLYGTGRADS